MFWVAARLIISKIYTKKNKACLKEIVCPSEKDGQSALKRKTFEAYKYKDCARGRVPYK